ncbi:MAG: hypothetical protein IPQ07_45330 [Myxococcales bacterium]|nr:hypothetical protein [Myxococcales bacterium]
MIDNGVTCYAWSFEGGPQKGTASAGLSWIQISQHARLASTDALTALSRARGPMLSVFRCYGAIGGDGVFGCADAALVFHGDVSSSLDVFSRYCGFATHRHWAPDEVVRSYLATGDEALRESAHQLAWAASNDLHDGERAAARIAMYAAQRDARVLATREAVRLTLSVLGAESLEAAARNRVRLERSLGSQLLRSVPSYEHQAAA